MCETIHRGCPMSTDLSSSLSRTMFGKRLSTGSENSVQEHLEGLCLTAPHVRLLDGFPQIKVAFNVHHDPHRVALVSGGGSGHEPAFAGYVGAGMLAAAACGDIFAAPSADAILAAIRCVTGDAGCLLLPLNYTGDRLNFGLAAERARGEGLRVETVLIDEDCSVRDSGLVGRRGLAGCVFVLKLVGACAQRGRPIEELADFARRVVLNLGTIGIGLDTCALPGQPKKESRLSSNEIELGLGLHGEPGVEREENLERDSVVDQMLQLIMNYNPCPFHKDTGVGVLINSLGGMAVMDLNSVANRALYTLMQEDGFRVEFAMVGTFVTSVTVAGFSITLLKMENEYIELLKDPTNALAWTSQHIHPVERHPKIPLPKEDKKEIPVEEPTEKGILIRNCVQAVTDCLVQKEEILNEWDTKVGDGDCGTTLVQACEAIREDMAQYPFNQPAAVLKALGDSIGRSSGGTSGALYNIFFTAASHGMNNLKVGSSETERWIAAFKSGLMAIETYGRARRGARTMLDALEPACDSLKESLACLLGLEETLENLSTAATAGADSTIGMIAQAGRSSYVPVENFETTPDPGAKAAEYWLHAIAQTILSSENGLVSTSTAA